MDSHSPALYVLENGTDNDAILNSAAPEARKKPMRVPLTSMNMAGTSPNKGTDV
jgi:hypothetical protein